MMKKSQAGFYRTFEGLQLSVVKRSDEIPGMDDQLTACILEEEDGLFYRRKIIV
jgi:hypothetical protein